MSPIRLIPLSLCIVGAVAACSARPGPAPERPAEPEPEPIPQVVEEVDTVPDEPPVEAEPALLGVIVSRTGSPYLTRYAGLVLDGARLAVDEHNRLGGRPVEMVVVDDAGDPAEDARLIRELERQGVVGVVGPLLPQGVVAAASARTDSLLTIISPTASDVPYRANVYSLNTGDTQGAEALADYAASAGIRQVGLLYPQTPDSRRRALAFEQAFLRAGGAITVKIPFAPGTTTFGPVLDTLATVRPEALFVPAGEREIHQLAPQLAYFALSDSVHLRFQVLGGEAWTTEAVRGRVAAQYLEGVVAAMPLDKSSPEVGWQDFLRLYESTYRRTLDNPLPALGYDAARLLLAALEAADTASAAAVAEHLRQVEDLRGATGVLAVEDAGVVRRPFLVRIEGGEMVPLPPVEPVVTAPVDTLATPVDTLKTTVPDPTVPVPPDTATTVPVPDAGAWRR